MKEVILGMEAEITELPYEIKIDRMFYYLLKDEESYRLVSRACPHAGALIEAEDGELVCYMHGWCFDAHTGDCLNIPGKRLDAYGVIAREGQLIAQFQD
ncbi:Rieske (2Fe-2S) protein [Paenibacillus piri]|uniref:Rieske (2Fe-2S) protein n=1 Tax=Paenibacillus piri TaxID=2547395 RepID=A0A4R5KXH4_9BACL|nr:Rieske (2Fe-2S) protein [Paenibacillus piri]TDF99777.1 Rieske (2Fe-2S) protein [Paenibacillus piri]